MDQSTSVEESAIEEAPGEKEELNEQVIHVKETETERIIEVRVPMVNVKETESERETQFEEQVRIVKEMDNEKGTQIAELSDNEDAKQLDDSVEEGETSMDAIMDDTRDEDYSEEEGDLDDEEDDSLFPFVCGICDYRFNRISVYYRHFQMHSDMVTEEYFHPCLEEEGEVKSSPSSRPGEISTDIFTCGACSVEFPTLCSLHEHLSQSPSTKLYIIDIDEKKALPKGRKCVGSMLNGANEIDYQEGIGVLKKSEAEEVYDDDVEGTSGDGDDSSEVTNSQKSAVPDVAEAGSQTINDDQNETTSQDMADKKAGIQRITVNYGSRKETFVVQKNETDDKGEAAMGSESEADMDMSDVDVEDHSYEDTPKTNRKNKNRRMKSEKGSLDDSFFSDYEGEKVRGKLIKIESPQVLKELGESAKYAEGEGENMKVHCPVCEKIVHHQYVTKHIKKCHADERCSCDICGKVFANRGYLKDHKRFVHEGIRRKSIVKVEGVVSPSPKTPRFEGVKICGEEDGHNTKVYCPQCEKPILRSYLPKHMQKVHSEKNVECEICGRLFTNRGYLADHKRYMHEGKKKRSVMMRYRAKDPALQALCDSASPAQSTLNKTRVNCPKCPKVVLEEYLAKHLRQAHSDQECPCDICGKVFSCQRFLNDHKRCVHTEYDTQCEICMKMFKGKSAREKHKKMVHSDALPYECAQCGRRFRSNVEYSRHMTIHNDLGVYCYQCPRCERRFKTQKAMNYHDRSVHKRIGRLQCKWPGCGRILNDRASFKKHYLIHTGDRPNKCPHCERAFIQRVALKYHLRKEHNVHELPPGHIPCHRRDSDIKIEPEEHAVPVPLYVQEEDGTEDYSEMEVVQAISDAATVDISDSAIVSDLIQIAQSSEGAVVPEALQHVFDGNNKTIVIYYQ